MSGSSILLKLVEGLFSDIISHHVYIRTYVHIYTYTYKYRALERDRTKRERKIERDKEVLKQTHFGVGLSTRKRINLRDASQILGRYKGNPGVFLSC